MANEFIARHGLIVLGTASASFFSGDGANLTNLPFSALTGVPNGLVSSSAQVNSGSFTGSFTGSLLGNATSAVTAAYAMTAGASGDGVTGGGTAGSIPLWSDVKVLTDSPLTATAGSVTSTVPFTSSIFTGSLIGLAESASWALTAAYADNVVLDWSGLTGIPVGIVSSSTQATTWTVATASFVDAGNITLGTLGNARLPSQINVVGVTASLLGTASWAVNATNAITATSVEWSGINNRPAGLVSSSIQTIANIAGQEISPSHVTASDIFVHGRVTAQEFHTQFVSASIIYQSGSTKFGDTSDDVMSVTGTLHVSGTTVIEGPITFTEGLGSTIFGGSLYDTATETVNIGTTVIATVSTASYDMAHFKYVAKSGSNLRTGEVMGVWNEASVEHTDTSTNDIGDTTNVVFDVDILGENARLKAVISNTNDWTIKTIIQAI